MLCIDNPYCGKPSDMWALGVLFYTMLYGQFPFYDGLPQELFRKIKSAEYTIPMYAQLTLYLLQCYYLVVLRWCANL